MRKVYGTTVLWSPVTDGDAPWIWNHYACIGHEESVVDVIGIEGLGLSRMVIDNKAMRIVRNQEVQLVVENTTVGNAGSVNAVGQVRTLFGQ